MPTATRLEIYTASLNFEAACLLPRSAPNRYALIFDINDTGLPLCITLGSF